MIDRKKMGGRVSPLSTSGSADNAAIPYAEIYKGVKWYFLREMGSCHGAIYLPKCRQWNTPIGKAKLNPLPPRPPIIPEKAIVGTQSLPCGCVNATRDVNFDIHITRCFTIATARALFASPAISSFMWKHSAEHKRHTED